MLMLTRRKGEAIDLIDRLDGDKVIATVVVLEFLPDSVRLGFIAPPQVGIVRDNAKDKGDSYGKENFGNY